MASIRHTLPHSAPDRPHQLPMGTTQMGLVLSIYVCETHTWGGGLVVLPPRSSTKLPAVPSPFRPASAACTRKEVNILPATAAINTCAPNVRPPNQPVHVAFPLPTPVNAKRLQRALQGYDPAETTFLVDGFIHGFHINYFGTPTLSALHNHPSASAHRDIVSKKLTKELALGRIAGPFSSPPFPNFQSSPLGVVPKKEPNAFRHS